MLERMNPNPPGKHNPRKRRRAVVSCTECHRRKQKCDRDLPCANCRSRGCESACNYDVEPPVSNSDISKPGKMSPSTSHPIASSSTPLSSNDPFSTMAATWGYARTGSSTVYCLQKIEMAVPEDRLSISADSPTSATGGELLGAVAVDRYKDRIRQLPARVFVDKLVTIFMREFNWQYYLVDPDVFSTQLQEWHSLPLSIYSTEGLQGMSPDLRVFPALLFHMVATALLLLSDEEETEFATLKYAANMTFEDLACDFSASGADIVGLFGKKAMSVTTVQAEILRASFLKYTANVAESWHMIGIAIKDAQELGMHSDSLNPKPTRSSLEDILETQWLIERRRKLYMVLAMWDIQMSLILGRPGTVDRRHGFPSLPVDAPTPSDRRSTPIVPRNPERDPPTPLTRFLWLHELSGPLQEIQDLEHDGPYPRDFSKIERLHGKIIKLHESTPGIFRLANPDTTWDNHPEVAHWIQETRHYFHMFHAFSVMALHRLYVFHRKESRLEALRASLTILDMQKLMFEDLPSASWRNFMLFFGTFDAIVLIASIYILYPLDHPDLKHLSMRHIHWAIERFSIMQARNPFARSAEAVLRAIFHKVALSLSHSDSSSKTSDTLGPTNGTSDANHVPPSVELNKGLVGGQANNVSGSANIDTASFNMPDETRLTQNPWLFGATSLPNIMPMFATSDLVFNNLTAVQSVDNDIEAGDINVAAAGRLDWQFGGNVGDGSLWQVLNQFQQG